MTSRLILSAGMIAMVTLSTAAEEITVTGCAAAGVEGNCIVLKADGKTYDISAAQPTPFPGTYGTVNGTLTDKVSTCQQGQVIDPATWKVDLGQQCPVKTSQ
jgi:hypothetical protein